MHNLDVKHLSLQMYTNYKEWEVVSFGKFSMGEFLLPVYHRTQFLRWSNTFSTERSHYTLYYMLCFVHKLFWRAKFLVIEANICHDLMTILFQTSLGNRSNFVKSTCRVYYTCIAQTGKKNIYTIKRSYVLIFTSEFYSILSYTLDLWISLKNIYIYENKYKKKWNKYKSNNQLHSTICQDDFICSYTC